MRKKIGEDGITRNTTAINLQTLQTIYNKAVKEGAMEHYWVEGDYQQGKIGYWHRRKTEWWWND